jgi:hypothetical protein
MPLSRQALNEIAEGRAPKAGEVTAMAEELLHLRDDDRDGTVLVTVEHESATPIAGWFAPHAWRMPASELHVGGRVTMGGRIYSVTSVDQGDTPTVHVR